MLQALGKKPPQGKKEGKKERMPPLLLRAKSAERPPIQVKKSRKVRGQLDEARRVWREYVEKNPHWEEEAKLLRAKAAARPPIRGKEQTPTKKDTVAALEMLRQRKEEIRQEKKEILFDKYHLDVDENNVDEQILWLEEEFRLAVKKEEEEGEEEEEEFRLAVKKEEEEEEDLAEEEDVVEEDVGGEGMEEDLAEEEDVIEEGVEEEETILKNLSWERKERKALPRLHRRVKKQHRRVKKHRRVKRDEEDLP